MFAFKVAAVDLKSADCNGAVRAGRAEPCHCGRSWELCHRICDIIVFIRIPETKGVESGSVLKLAKGGIQFLQENPMIMTLIFFMSGVNLVASAFDATLPGYVLPNPKGGSSVLGLVTSCAGIAMILGSLSGLCSAKTKGQSAGNLFDDAVFARHRKFRAGIFQRASFMVYRSADWLDTCASYECESGCDSQNKYSGRFAGACVRLPQYISIFTIPIGLFAGGFMVDRVCEPFMSAYGHLPMLNVLFGAGKGSGAALMMFLLGVSGSLICLLTGKKLKKYHYSET